MSVEEKIQEDVVKCDRFYRCVRRLHLLPGEQELYCESEKFHDCPYDHDDFVPRRDFYRGQGSFRSLILAQL
jgi:hypothetical protein